MISDMEGGGVYSSHECHLMSVCWIFFNSASICHSFDLDCILQKGDLLFKSFNNCRYLGMEDLPQEISIENLSINVEFRNYWKRRDNCWCISCVFY